MLYTIAAALAFASVSVSSPATSNLRPRQDSPYVNAAIPSSNACPSGVHVIAASGQGSPPVGGYGLIMSLVTDIVNAIPGSTNVSLTYPKQSDQQIAKIATGSDNLLAYLPQYYSACPETPFVLLGYSAGAIIVLNALCGGSAPWTTPAGPISSNWTSAISSIVLYGDETHDAYAPFNVGTCISGDGQVPRTNTDACAPFDASIHSYCDTPDPRCCRGTVDSAHFQYPAKYDQDATNFVVSKYEG